MTLHDPQREPAEVRRPGASRRVRARRIGASPHDVVESIATEEPLEIRVRHSGVQVARLVTMRTPGDDLDLAAGWLLGEGVLRGTDDVVTIMACTDAGLTAEERGNVVTADLEPDAAVRAAALERTVDMTSACGVCGSSSLQSVLDKGLAAVTSDVVVDGGLVVRLPELLRERQRVFQRTGGLHAAGVFAADGTTAAVREDVGRHNAVDKVLGSLLLGGRLPLSGHVLVVSSRASFEIVQKAVSAGVAVVVAVSAPSTLAVDLADAFGVTLVGFAREGRATVYTHPHRVA